MPVPDYPTQPEATLQYSNYDLHAIVTPIDPEALSALL